jgi:hypothetical protein
LGAETLTRFPFTVLCTSVSEPPASERIPAPSAWAVIPPPAVLSLTVVSTSVSFPQLSMPPPPAYANGHGPFGHLAPTLATVTVGVARLPVTKLLLIVTVARGAISIPPASAVARR